MRGTTAYDVIFVGAGTAGCITAARLQQRFPERRILILEMGGPTAAAVGGSDHPPYYAGVADKLTIFDVPGEYANIAWHPKGARYQIPATGFTYQGMGYGGNSQFNGMLVHVPADGYFDTHWPEGWKADSMKACFERVFSRMTVTDTPSPDGVHYNDAAAEIAARVYRDAGFAKADTPNLGDHGPNFYGWPFVVTARGIRGGPAASYLRQLVDGDGHSKHPNLDVIRYAEVDRVVFDDEHPETAIGVAYRRRYGLESRQSTPHTARLSRRGIVVMSAGALNTPRLLLLSGVGPRRLHDEIFPDGGGVPFTIDNPLVGASVSDHFGTSVTFTYDGEIAYRAYDYGDYNANAHDLDRYVLCHTGPYAQYQPVFAAETRIGDGGPAGVPDVEVFINPNGVGTPGLEFYPPNAFTAFALLLETKARAVLQLDAAGHVKAPDIYLTSPADVETMTTAIFDVLLRFTGGRYDESPDTKILFGPGGASFPDLDPAKRDDVRRYVTHSGPFTDGAAGQVPVYFTGLTINHFGGTCPLHEGPGGTDPRTLAVKGTRNVHVVDASIQPREVPGHPVATIMASAEKAGELLGEVLARGA